MRSYPAYCRLADRRPRKGPRVTGIDAADAWPQLQRLVAQLHELEVVDPASRKLIDELHNVLIAGGDVVPTPQADQLRLLFDAAPDAYILTDRGGMIEDANPPAVQLLGLNPSKEDRSPLVLSVDRAHRPAIQRLLRSAGTSTGKPPVVAAPSSGAHAEVWCVPVGTDRLLWVLHDVSEAERLRVVDAMRKALLLAVSHDLRTPLVAIAEYSSLLEDDRLDDDQRTTALSRLRSTAQDTLATLNDLLDYERIEHAAMSVRRDDVDVAEVVRRVLDTISADQHTVHADLSSTPARVDATIVERVITNLVGNAIQHTPPGSTVWVRCRREPDGVRLVVEDDGPGIPTEHRQTAFELFHRHHNAGHSGGLGIGLALVRRFAQLHGGYARAEDRPGGGASLQVLLGVSDVSPECHQD